VHTPELVISSEPTPNEVQYLEDRLYEFNAARTGIKDGEWLAIFVKDDAAGSWLDSAGTRGTARRKSASSGWRRRGAGRDWGHSCSRQRERGSSAGLRADAADDVQLPGSGLLCQARIRSGRNGG
jgi:hypothetical protein